MVPDLNRIANNMLERKKITNKKLPVISIENFMQKVISIVFNRKRLIFPITSVNVRECVDLCQTCDLSGVYLTFTQQ